MFPVSCILLGLAVVATHEHVFTYVKPWDPFRRSITECEMCYKGDCVVTRGPRCEYYADATRVISDDGDEEDEVEREIHQDGSKIDGMIFDLVNSASLTLQFKGCVPLVSQYTDCTEENICTGCEFCSCTEEGRWTCSKKEKCRPEPRLRIDHRVVGIVIENLKRKEKNQERRVKRSAMKTKRIKDKVTYADISKWMYGVEPFNFKPKNMGIGQILEYLKSNDSIFDVITDIDQANSTTVTSALAFTTNTSMDKNDSYIDLLEFNDILQSWTTDELSTKRTTQIFTKHRSEEIQINDVDYSEYDPIRLIKRDTSKQTNETRTILQNNIPDNNFTYEIILTDALEGLNKITNEKQKELEELLNIQSNLVNIAKAFNISTDINFTITHDNYNKHHIAIYKLDKIEKCVAKVKYDIRNTLEDVIKSDAISNSSDLQRDLKLVFSIIGKYILPENTKKVNTEATQARALSSQELDENPRRQERYQIFNPIVHIRNILTEINKVPANPLRPLSHQAQKILKRVIKQMYLDDFAVIDFIVHETYYDFDSYLENIGTKWNKMMHDVIHSDVFDTLYRVKLLHMTLKTDISKIEDMITLLDFARNRRMTVANGVTIDKSILRIQNNLQLIDNNVQKIMKLEKNKRLRQSSAPEKNKPVKKKSILQKLKKMFQSSKKDIKDMLRKRFPKSEIMKQITKKKINELENRRMLDYQETIKQWQENLNVVSERKKRSASGFQAFVDRIKSIIPRYLRGKVKPAMRKKKTSNKTQIMRRQGRKNKLHTKLTTIKTTTVSQRPAET